MGDRETMFIEDIARESGLGLSTLRGYATRAQNGRPTPGDMPKALPGRVRREVRTSGGHERVVWSSVWDAAAIREWLPRRPKQGGHPRDQADAPAEADV